MKLIEYDEYIPTIDDRLSIEDIPTDVLVEIWKKWEPVKEWSYNLWNPCALCKWMTGFYVNHRSYDCVNCTTFECEDCGMDDVSFDKCEICPLGIDNWCQGEISNSRISLLHYYEDETEWYVELRKFITFIEGEMFRR